MANPTETTLVTLTRTDNQQWWFFCCWSYLFLKMSVQLSWTISRGCFVEKNYHRIRPYP